MKFSLWQQYGALNSKPVFESFAYSLQKAGHEILWNQPGGIPVIWSVLWHGRMRNNQKIWQQHRSKNKPVIVLEVGGIKRGITWRVGLNGVNRDAYFAPQENNSDRARLLGLELQPWKNIGDHILVCCQHEQSEQWQGQPPMTEWVKKTVNSIRQYTDRRIVVRPHPRYRINLSTVNAEVEQPRQIKNTYDDYDLNFQNAWAVVSHSSNPGPHAILAGTPAFVSSSSLAYPVGNTDYSLIESPLMPDRTQWLNDYAHTEYTLDEIREGIPLKCLTKKLA